MNIEADVAEDLDVQPLIEFLSEGDHNLLVFADFESRRHVRSIANILGVDLEAPVS